MNKKLTGIVSLFLMVVLFFTSCGGDGEDTDTDANTDAASDIDTAVTTLDIIDEPDVDIPDDGIPRERVFRILSSEELYTNLWKYGYDDKGRLTYIRKERETEPILKISYGEDGYVSEIIDMSSHVDEIFQFENGNLVYRDYFSESGSAYGYAYDEAGRVTSEIIYDKYNGEVSERVDYRYETDPNGNATAKYTIHEGVEFLT